MYITLANPQIFEKENIDILENIVEFFNDKTKELSKSIIFSLIKTYDELIFEYQNEIKKIKNNPNILEKIDLEKFYDYFLNLEEYLQTLLNLLEKHKSKDEVFTQLYDRVDILFDLIVKVDEIISIYEVDLIKENEKN